MRNAPEAKVDVRNSHMILAGVCPTGNPDRIISDPLEMNKMLRDESAKTFSKPFDAFPRSQAAAFLGHHTDG